MMVIENKFNIGETVYLKTDPDQFERIILFILISPNTLTYGLGCGNELSYHYDIELTKEKIIVNG